MRPPSLQAFTSFDELAWPADGSVIVRGNDQSMIIHRSEDGATKSMIMAPSAVRDLARPVMPRVSFLVLEEPGWKLYMLGGPNYGTVVGWWMGAGDKPEPPAGSVIEEELGSDLMSVLRSLATERPGS